MEIPQTVIAKTDNNATKRQPAKTAKNRREDATAVAVTAVQGMVWIHPTHTPLTALQATQDGTLQPPPRIPEIDLEGYKTTAAVRDFPIDWTVLMENIMDPDHGLIAHAGSGAMAKGFE